MNTCKSCGSGFYVDEECVSGYESLNMSHDYWLNYVQNGAGISAMLEPLLSVSGSKSKSLLDIGCGFGFVPHFWKTMNKAEAIGLETSEYGAIGSEKLGVQVVRKYYAAATELSGKNFDIVYSSEVIEHVPSPAEFIREISAALADNGILILTTPCADALKPSTNRFTLLAALSPGFHYFLLSENALRDILHKSGFSHVEIHNSGTRLFAWASKSPLPPITEGFSGWDTYLDYLDLLSANEDAHVACGALYRGMKDSYNLNLDERARKFFSNFQSAILEFYDLDLKKPETFLRRIRSSDIQHGLRHQNFQNLPTWAGPALYFSAKIRERAGASATELRDLLAASIEAMQLDIDTIAQFAGEAAYYINPAKQEHARLDTLVNTIQGATDIVPYHLVLRHPGSVAGQDICLFAAYSAANRVTAATADYIQALTENGIRVVVVLALDNPHQDIDLSGLEAAAGVMVRKNSGFDFGSWGAGLQIIPECWKAKRLYFANDSNFVLKSLFERFAEKLRAQDASFVAVTESYQIEHHAQSYFFMLQDQALVNAPLRAYLSNIPTLKSKTEVIKQLETTLLTRIQSEYGLSAAILFPMHELFPGVPPENYQGINITHQYWDYLVTRGFPFVKAELLRDNPLRKNILHWPWLFSHHGSSVENAIQHIEARRGSPTAEPALCSTYEHLPKWLRILKELNRARLAARRARRRRTWV